jgi:hypothetical protein
VRGVLLVTAAVILIVLGLKSSDSGIPASAKDRDQGVLNLANEALLQPSDALASPEGGGLYFEDEQAPAQLPVGPGPQPEGDLPFVLEDAEPNPGGGGQAEVSDQQEPAGVETVPAWEPSSPGDKIIGGGGGGSDQGPRAFVLGRPSGETGPLAQALLEAWIAQSTVPLQDELDKAESTEVAEAQSLMVTAFWQAMVGKSEEAREQWASLSSQSIATSAQLAMLASALEFKESPSIPEHAGRKDPLARSMRMVLLEAASEHYAKEGQHPKAALALSELLMSEVNAPWDPHREALNDWAVRLNESQSFHRLSARGDWPSLTYTVARNESLELIRKRVVRQKPGLLMCTGLIGKVNSVGRYIHPGDVLRIPTSTCNMLVDLDARMAFYRHGSEIVMAWTVGIGREGAATPVGTFTVGDKLKEPVWTRRGQKPLPFGHPDNLLGARWLGWYQDGVKTDYGFHGTNDPEGVGGRVSSGCIRMRDADVSMLFELLPSGCKVVVQP